MSAATVTDRNVEVLATGIQVKTVGMGKAFLAWLIDLTVLTVGAVAAYVVTSRTTFYEWQPFIAAIAVWLVLPFLQGTLAYRGKTLGGAITSSRFVRSEDGRPVNPPRMAWVCFKHEVLFVLLIIGAAMMDGSGLEGSNERHRPKEFHIDEEGTRSLGTELA